MSPSVTPCDSDHCPQEAVAGGPHTEGCRAQRGHAHDTASSLWEAREAACWSVTPTVSRVRLVGLQWPSRGCPRGPVASGCPRQWPRTSLICMCCGVGVAAGVVWGHPEGLQAVSRGWRADKPQNWGAQLPGV